MNEEAAFIAALVKDPSDRTAALMFADWLDERDDPHGPKLRIDAVRARMYPAYGPEVQRDIVAVIGATGGETVPLHHAALANPERRVRIPAIRAIGAMRDKSPETTTLLRAAETDPDRRVREAAVVALKKIAGRKRNPE